LKDISYIRKLIADLNGQISLSNFAEEELVLRYDEGDHERNTFEIEALGSIYKTSIDNDDSESQFNFFEDGKQRTIQIAYLTIVKEGKTVIIPIHYYAIAAVILKRVKKKLSLYCPPSLETGIVLHKKVIQDSERINQISKSGLKVLDTSDYETIQEESNNYYSLKLWALEAVKKRRLEIEQSLIEKWRLADNSKDFLVVDGPLINLRGEENLKRCIGVSRGSRIDMDEYDKIILLNEFERSWTFSFHPNDEKDKKNLGVRDRISWYLRLRSKINSNPEFGLVRPEIHFSHRDKATELADKFSKSLIIERFPLSYPESNWDRTLYPIAVCSNYLSSIMPSIRSIKSLIKL
jgi:hypothetical protein